MDNKKYSVKKIGIIVGLVLVIVVSFIVIDDIIGTQPKADAFIVIDDIIGT